MKEEWRDIKGWEGFYQISNKGNVKSLPRQVNATSRKGKKYKISLQTKFLKPSDNGCGYLRVLLRDKFTGRSKNMYLHRLVASAFIPNPNGLSDVHHKDGNPYNNKVENLAWLSHKDNLTQPERLERMSASLKNFYSAKKEVEVLWTL